MSEDKTQDTVEEEKVGPGAYIALLAALVFFSGIFYKIDGYKWLGALDFTTLAGAFGQISGKTFVGSGGIGARSGFLFALSLALGILEIVTYYGAIRAAQKLMTPLLYPILGIPGRTGLALITDLQSTDAGAALTKGLADQGQITKKDLVVMCAWQYSGAGLINNYFAIGSALFAACLVPVVIPLIVMFILKFVGAVLVRILLNTVYRKDFQS